LATFVVQKKISIRNRIDKTSSQYIKKILDNAEKIVENMTKEHGVKLKYATLKPSKTLTRHPPGTGRNREKQGQAKIFGFGHFSGKNNFDNKFSMVKNKTLVAKEVKYPIQYC
jgi:hypothetical protein